MSFPIRPGGNDHTASRAQGKMKAPSPWSEKAVRILSQQNVKAGAGLLSVELGAQAQAVCS